MLQKYFLILLFSYSLSLLAQENATLSSSSSTNIYFPPIGKDWATMTPTEAGLKTQSLNEAIAFAQANEYSGSRDLRIAILEGFQREPFHYIAGPTKKRGGPAGMILKQGKIVAQWGDIDRVDMTFSVTKSYLSTLAGLAVDKGLITSPQDKVADYVWDRTFQGTHNSQVTWDHLLTQSSDWSGELFGMKDWADRPPREGGVDDWKYRELQTPGTFFEYNDVRVNVLAYSLLQVWRKPLPVVLKEEVMDKIGASTTWRWFGYENSFVNVDGQMVQSVSGGGHSGGGVFISARDHARFGLLFLNKGNWAGQQIISKEWVNMIQQPSEANESYGYMWWLNKGKRSYAGVPSNMYYAAGFGGNYIIVLPDQEMVVVTRWLEPKELGNFMQKVMSAVK
ncbi:MAG: serine hydrolase [Bacteroidota bacterium]